MLLKNEKTDVNEHLTGVLLCCQEKAKMVQPARRRVIRHLLRSKMEFGRAISRNVTHRHVLTCKQDTRTHRELLRISVITTG